MIIMIKKRLLLIGTTLLLSSTLLLAENSDLNDSNALVPFKATYKVFRKGSELGEAYRHLTKNKQTYTLETDSKISWLFLSDNRHEVSKFKLEQGKIVPQSYDYKRTGTGRDRVTHTQFSSPTISTNYKSKDYQLAWQDNVLDPQLYQLVMQQQLIAGGKEFDYSLVKRGKLVQYRFKIIGQEQLSLPYGKLDTVKIQRIRESSKRNTLMWVAPSLNYAMVKLTQYKNGKEQADLQLSWLQFTSDDAAEE